MINQLLKFSLFVFCLLCFNCKALELTPNEAEILEKFFKVLIEKSEAGYVIAEQKPVCIHGYNFKEYFVGENDRHYSSVCLREGAKVLKKINQHSAQGNIIVHVYDQPDSLVKNYVHILTINKNLFLKTIEANLSLFQYVLGPNTTSEALLKKLIDPKEQFHKVLKDDKVLIGILLGFGVQNSLYVSRIEDLENTLVSAEKLPLEANWAKLKNPPEELAEMLLLSEKPKFVLHNEQPSFGFKSLEEELHTLREKITVSSQKLTQNPQFIFGRLKDSFETDIAIRELEKTQLKILSFVNTENFLEETLKKLFPNEPIIITKDNGKTVFENPDLERLPLLVAANLRKVFEDEDPVFQESFIEGMKDSEQKKQRGPLASTHQFQILGALLKAKENLIEAHDFFSLLDKNSNYNPILHGLLYYRIEAEGQGSILNQEADVTLYYTIKSPNNEILADTFTHKIPERLHLDDTIPGFALGLKKMKIGEIREILIHPQLAYGILTTLDKGIYLRVIVQLIDFIPSQSNRDLRKPSLLPIKISPTIEEDYKRTAKAVGYATGYKLWEHYKKSNFYSLAQVLEKINESAEISSQKDQDILSKLHWLIYRHNESSLNYNN